MATLLKTLKVFEVSYDDDDDDGNDDDITCGFAEIGDCGHKNDDRWRKWSKLDFWNIIASSVKKSDFVKG